MSEFHITHQLLYWDPGEIITSLYPISITWTLCIIDIGSTDVKPYSISQSIRTCEAVRHSMNITWADARLVFISRAGDTLNVFASGKFRC